jgi:hypothetical protein
MLTTVRQCLDGQGPLALSLMGQLGLLCSPEWTGPNPAVEAACHPGKTGPHHRGYGPGPG